MEKSKDKRKNTSSHHKVSCPTNMKSTTRKKKKTKQKAIPTPIGTIRDVEKSELENLIKASQTEIIQTLQSRKKYFKHLLLKPNISKNLVNIMVAVLGNTFHCSTECLQSFLKVAVEFHSESDFASLKKYLFDWINVPKNCEDFKIDSLHSLLTFIQELYKMFSRITSKKLLIISSLLQYVIEIMDTKCASDLEEKNSRENFNNDEDHTTFRQMPVLPTNEELNTGCSPSLKPIIKYGAYHNVEQYLDIQFKLIREDFLRPLRDGINEHLIALEEGFIHERYKRMKLYTNVYIQGLTVSTVGILHVISFNPDLLHYVNWETSKRLLVGSTLCLSNDNFKTTLIATVAKRNHEDLRSGLLEIEIENIDNMLNIDTSVPFAMIEINANFDAYRHILTTLQQTTEDTLLLQEYIIKCRSEVKQPGYIKQNTLYNFRKLTEAQSGYQDRMVRVSDLQDWPSGEDLGLDESQVSALESAMTKELTIIQGPPGTGKTYIGLKIVQLLLDNYHIWNPSQYFSPIVIMCYTNRALDKILEGILKITKSVVRMGGGCTNENVSNYSFKTLRRKMNNIQTETEYNISDEIKSRMANISEIVNQIEMVIDRASNTILTLTELEQYMSCTHHSSFVSSIEGGLSTQHFTADTVISKWLNVAVDVEGSTQYKKSPAGMTDSIEQTIRYNAVGTESATKQTSIREHCKNFAGAGLNFRTNLQFTRLELTKYDIMARDEENEIKDIWSIRNNDRWKLYRLWISRYRDHQTEEIIEHLKLYKQNLKTLNEFRDERDKELMRNIKVIGVTINGAAKFKSLLHKLKPRILIVEEAASISEAHLISSLTSTLQHVILIGDHKQLRPTTEVYELAKNYNLDLSLFERLIGNGIQFSHLSFQHRMRPSISNLLTPHIYSELHNHHSVTKYEDIKGVCENVFFLSHNSNENSVRESQSPSNTHEATFLVALCKYLLLQGYQTSQITVLTMYTGQLILLKRLINSPVFEGINVSLVDNFQGEENHIILVSFVRSNDRRNIGFLDITNRICVALSRAKAGFYCVGNFELFSQTSTIWKNIIHKLKDKNLFGYSLKLKCQNHPTNVTNMVSAEDFARKVPDGCCDLRCGYRLECGHTCGMECHLENKKHENFKCTKRCSNVCSNGHFCQKPCFEECGKCLELVRKVISPCNHETMVVCHRSSEQIICDCQCSVILPCGHTCPGICGNVCLPCNKTVQCSSLCGHDVFVDCVRRNDDWQKLNSCRKPCSQILECGHLCKGKCNECHQGRVHMPCAERCNQILVCGHECMFPCSKNCPPCPEKCENRCVHNRCSGKCHEICVPCKEFCEWKCEHYECKRLCGEMCDRPPCNLPCSKLLKCGHRCIGLCGEVCPNLCRVCNHDEATELFFGREDEEEACFIQLEDCGHIFEANGLATWMETNEKSNTEILMKRCPKCKTVIWRSLRFGNLIKSCFMDVQKVKRKLIGSKDDNRKKQQKLDNKLLALNSAASVIAESIIEIALHSTHMIDVRVIESLIFKITVALQRLPHAQLLSVVENCLLLLKDMVSFGHIFMESVNMIKNCCSHDDHLWNFLQDTISIVLCTMEKPPLTSISSQQLHDISREVNRLNLLAKLFHVKAKTINSRIGENFEICYQEVLKLLTKFTLFTDTDSQLANKKLKELIKYSGGCILGISESERREILKAMNLARGHWFRCPRGHVFCITECGGAMEEAVCNECSATIGGTNHALLPSNQLAREMDGAAHAAWSNEANILN